MKVSNIYALIVILLALNGILCILLLEFSHLLGSIVILCCSLATWMVSKAQKPNFARSGSTSWAILLNIYTQTLWKTLRCPSSYYMSMLGLGAKANATFSPLISKHEQGLV